MLNEQEYTKLVKNTVLIAEYLKEKLQEVREPISIRFGEEKAYGIATKKEYALNLGSGCADVSANNGRIVFEFSHHEGQKTPAYYERVFLFDKRCFAGEKMMIHLILNWQEIRAELENQLRHQQYIREMIEDFKL